MGRGTRRMCRGEREREREREREKPSVRNRKLTSSPVSLKKKKSKQ